MKREKEKKIDERETPFMRRLWGGQKEKESSGVERKEGYVRGSCGK